ncbi:hypothetical protein ACXYFN_03215 [Mycoplasma sp. 48589B]
MNLKRILFTCTPLVSIVALPLAAVSCNNKTEEQKLAEEYVNLYAEAQKIRPGDPKGFEIMEQINQVESKILKLGRDKQDAINKEIERLLKERNIQPLA